MHLALVKDDEAGGEKGNAGGDGLDQPYGIGSQV